MLLDLRKNGSDLTLRILTISKPYVASSYRSKLLELDKLGMFHLGMICPEQWATTPYEEDDFASKIWTRRLPIYFNGHNHFHMYRGLKSAIKDFRPDIVNIEEEHYSLVTWQAYRLALAAKAKPIFYTWQNIQKQYPFPFSATERFVFKHSSAAVAGNQEAADILRQKGYAGRLAVIPQMGVDLDRFSYTGEKQALQNKKRKNLDLPEKVFLITFAGRIVEEKGLQTIIQAFQALPEANHLRLLVLGDGPYLKQLRNLVETLKEDRVIFRSQVPSKHVADYLKASDMMCLPSLTRPNWKEQFGRIIVEAMAAGAVPIGSSSGEIPNVIGNTGFIFPEGDSQFLANILLKTLQPQANLEHLRQLAQARASEHFSNRTIAKSFAELFCAVLNDRPQ
jgi:glycosyltransferase involved in cell wall biosynthesis